MIFNLVDSVIGGEDLGSGPITVTFLYYSTANGLFKVLEKHCASGGSVTAPNDVGNIASTEGSASVLFSDQTPALTFQGWTTTALTGLTYDLVVGALYIPTDGKTHFSLRLNAVTGLNPIIYLTTTGAGTATIEWGDSNSNTDSTVGSVTFSHTYASAGDYWIKLSRDTGSYAPGQGTNTTMFIGGNIANIRNSLFACHIGSKITTILTYAFNSYFTLLHITLPIGITQIDTRAFNTCNALQNVIMPNTVTTIGTYAYGYCKSLRYIVISSNLTTLPNYVFMYSESAIEITATAISTINNGVFYYCGKLIQMVMPSSLTYIGDQTFEACYTISEYFFLSTTPPTLAAANAFTGIVSSTRIYVPDASVSAYKNATNWVTYKDYIYGISTRS